MGNLNFQFTNNPADDKPELTLTADGATQGEKILLNNILTGVYGTPRILGGISSGGMATMLKITFDDNPGDTLATQSWVQSQNYLTEEDLPEPGGLPYKLYVARITQSGTDDPVEHLVYNNFGESVVWNREEAGYYTGIMGDGFLFGNERLFGNVIKQSSSEQFDSFYLDNIIHLRTKTTGPFGGDSVLNCVIEIKEYPIITPPDVSGQ